MKRHHPSPSGTSHPTLSQLGEAPTERPKVTPTVEVPSAKIQQATNIGRVWKGRKVAGQQTLRRCKGGCDPAIRSETVWLVAHRRGRAKTGSAEVAATKGEISVCSGKGEIGDAKDKGGNQYCGPAVRLGMVVLVAHPGNTAEGREDCRSRSTIGSGAHDRKWARTTKRRHSKTAAEDLILATRRFGSGISGWLRTARHGPRWCDFDDG